MIMAKNVKNFRQSSDTLTSPSEFIPLARSKVGPAYFREAKNILYTPIKCF